MFKIILLVVIGTIALIGVFTFMDPNNASLNGTTDVTETTKNTFSVTVEGAVYKPGTYTLEEDATMEDLLSAAGGVTSAADDRAYYEDALLVKGMTYYIASRYDASDLCSTTELTKVNVNNDEASVLTTANGITSSIAESIVTYRTSNGLFSTIEQLQEVYGIGSATYKKIRNYVILHEWLPYSFFFLYI